MPPVWRTTPVASPIVPAPRPTRLVPFTVKSAPGRMFSVAVPMPWPIANVPTLTVESIVTEATLLMNA